MLKLNLQQAPSYVTENNNGKENKRKVPKITLRNKTCELEKSERK